jgi:hypothetical protein
MYTNKIALENYKESNSRFTIFKTTNDISILELNNLNKLYKNASDSINEIYDYYNNNTEYDLFNFIVKFNKISHSFIHKFFNEYTVKYNNVSNYMYTLGSEDNEYLSCTGTYGNNFAIKINILYDFLQGLIINSFLHKKLPHFVITYALKKTGPSFFQEAFPNDILAITGHENPSYIYLKNINEEYYLYKEYLKAYNLYTILDIITVEDFLNVYYQLLLLLETSQREVSFVYYNNIYDNLIIENLDNSVLLQYYRNDGSKVKFLSNTLIRLINYDEVYQIVDNKIYTKTNIYQDKEFNCYLDIYLFLLNLIENVIKINRDDLYIICRYFMDYFNNKDSLEDILEIQLYTIQNMYLYPLNEESKDRNNFSKFINYCYQKYPIILSKNTYDENLLTTYKLQNLYDTWHIINKFNNTQLLNDYKWRAQLAIKQISKILTAKDVKYTYMYMDLYYKYKKLPKKYRLDSFMKLKNEVLSIINTLLKDYHENDQLKFGNLISLTINVKNYNAFKSLQDKLDNESNTDSDDDILL